MAFDAITVEKKPKQTKTWLEPFEVIIIGEYNPIWTQWVLFFK